MASVHYLVNYFVFITQLTYYQRKIRNVIQIKSDRIIASVFY